MRRSQKKLFRGGRSPAVSAEPISYVGVGTADSGDAPATLTPALPAGVQEGDLLVLLGSLRSSVANETMSVPAGWTSVIEGAGDGAYLHACFKVAGASESAPTVTWNNLDVGFDGAINQIAAWRDVDQADPIDALGTFVSEAASTGGVGVLGPVPGITAAGGAAVIVAGTVRNDIVSMDDLTGEGLDWEPVDFSTLAGGIDMTQLWQYAITAAGGAISDKTVTHQVGGDPGWCGAMFSLNPANVAPATPMQELTVTATGSGDVTGPGVDTALADNTESYPGTGTVVPLEASPDAGALFQGWSGDETSQNANLDVLMDQDKAVTATFTSPPPGGETVPGTGAILSEDLGTNANPLPLWKTDSSAFSDGTAGGSLFPDPHCVRLTADPDPHVWVGGGTSSGYRRFILGQTTTTGAQSAGTGTLNVVDTEGAGDLSIFPDSGKCSIFTPDDVFLFSFAYTGKTATSLTGCSSWSGSGSIPAGSEVRVQSIYDSSVPNSQYRTQIGRSINNPDQTFHLYSPGDTKITYLSTRFMNPWPQPGSTQWQDSMIFQIKQHPSGGVSPVLNLTESIDSVRLINNDGTFHSLAYLAAAKGLWHRFALIAHYNQDPAVGWVELWGDLTESGDLTQLTSRINCQTIIAGNPNMLWIGPYQRMERPALYREYANIQVCAWSEP